jgi:MFS transporter, DHA1 family, multidrug resistance protein
MPDVKPPPEPRTAWLLPVLGMLVAFAPLSIDMYLPALPALGRDLGASADQVQGTLALYFVGLALGQLLYGPLSDRYGRKKPLVAGFLLYLLASAGCALAPDLPTLMACRLAQALGGCAGVVIPMAMVRDRFDQANSARALSRLMLVMGAAPMLAPIAGAQLLALFGWRAIFWVLAGCALAALLLVHLALPETLAPGRRRPVTALGALRSWRELLGDRRYLLPALGGGLASAAMFAYIAASPFVLIGQHGLTPAQYGWVFGANACGLIAASQLNHRLLARLHPDVVLLRALAGMCVAAAALLASAVLAAPIWVLLLALFCTIAVLGFIMPNASAAAMATAGERAGSAAAVLGTLRFGAAAIAGAVVGEGAVSMALVMGVCAVASLLLVRARI